MAKGSKLKAGDEVRLNDYGVDSLFGFGASHMKTLPLRIIYVDSMNMTHPEETYLVNVDDREIDRYLLNDHMFDKFEGKGA